MWKSTSGWQLCVQWNYESTSCQCIEELKGSYPVQIAENTVAQDIDNETAFNWWFDSVLKKRHRVISIVKKRNNFYLNKTHKFGIKFPKMVVEAYDLDRNNGSTLWEDAIYKDMKDVCPDFKVTDDV